MSANTTPVIESHALAKTFKGVQAPKPMHQIKEWHSGRPQSRGERMKMNPRADWINCLPRSDYPTDTWLYDLNTNTWERPKP